jgi:hypothetical protein
VFGTLSALVLSLLAQADVATLQRSQPVARDKDGISASIKIDHKEITVRWRFLRPLSVPLNEVAATMNGRPLGVPSTEPYPGSDGQCFILLLADVSDPSRAVQIRREKATLFEVAGRAKRHHRIVVGVYSDSAQLLVPNDGKIGTLNAMLADATPRVAFANLNQVLQSSMDVISRIRVDRRAIFLLTDGHTDDVLDSERLVERAARNAISLNFILSPSNRTADLKTLETIAQATGGLVVGEAQREAFLKAPFELLDSGATVHFPLDNARRYFWELNPEVKVVFHYGDNSMELVSPADLPLAGFEETATFLRENHPLALAVGAGTMLALGSVTGLALKRRIKRRSKPEAKSQPLAILEDVDSGAAYPIVAPLAHLGRDSTNDIVLDDTTVSRLHAVLQQGAYGVFSLENRSETNPVKVNDRTVSKKTLADGDLIGLGSRTLRFRQSSASSSGAGGPSTAGRA